MELKDFVSQSLLQIFEGVKEAQTKTNESNGSIAPGGYRISTKEIPNHPSVVGFIHSTPVISVDFDVSVTTQDLSKEKAGLGIFVAAIAMGGQIGSESLNNQLNRLRFSVPVMLPASQ
ncbi:hypothetical protein MUO66_08765 [Candidatus Bathyarchaeota archaeon]|nr:hypothetical protein [Candidatus Bathyarchaeota archaeon]